MSNKTEDHWSSEAYQNAASFVPKLATKVIGWLDIQPDDKILDIGCGDGVLNLQFAVILQQGNGKIHGIDSSEAMIAASKKSVSMTPYGKCCTFQVLDATQLTSNPPLQDGTFSKVFSNAALHWILRPPQMRAQLFQGVHNALQPSGKLIFEMGGMGNVAEMRSTLLSVVSRRVGIAKAREADPWFFPDEVWMRKMLEESGFVVERLEREYRPTKADEGGIEGWVRLMGKQFFDVVEGEEEREECVKEAVEILGSVCESPGGGDWIGYVRLRGVAIKV